MKVVLVTGGFDPIHKGHVRMFKKAKEIADAGMVVVGLNSDDWLIRKKGKFFMSWDEREEIIEEMKSVDRVISFDDADNSCTDAIRQAYDEYDGFNNTRLIVANGGDRDEGNLPESEIKFCEEHGIEMLWGVGGGKIQSSSDLIKRWEDE